MSTDNKPIFIIRASLFLVGVYVFTSILYVTQNVILPLIYATGVAILISPVIDFLVRKKINRAVAISGVLLLVILVLGGLIALMLSQANMLRTAWPQLLTKLHTLLGQSVTWFAGYFNLSAAKINADISETMADLMKNRNAAIGVTLTTMSGILSATVLTPVYIFMILFYKPHLVAFVHQLFSEGNDDKVSEILNETKNIIKSYIGGLFLEFVIIAILNSVGLLSLRIDYAILLGVIGAVLNVIPIIGGVVCVLLFVVITLLTKSPIYVVYVLAVYLFIQFVDDHYIFPKVVGSKVKLNLLISIIAVIAGDALWGVPGMFIAIPITAIIKLIFDRIDSLKPWGFLLGDTVPPQGKIKFKFSIQGFSQSITKK